MANLFDIQLQDKNLKGKKLSNFSQRSYEGDYLPEGESDTGVMVPPIKRGRVYILFILILLMILIIFARLYWLQVIKGEDYRNIAEGNRVRILATKADRGLIYDRYFRSLVKNRPGFSLVVIPGDLPKDKEEKDKVLQELFSLLEMASELQDDYLKDFERIKEIFQNLLPHSYQEVKIKEDLDYQIAMRLELKLDKLPGICLKVEAEREYLQGQNLSHILGYVGSLDPEELDQYPDYLMTDSIGKTGLELYYEDLLKGKDGQKRIEVNSFGKEERVVSQQLPKTGQDLILSLDLDLQKKVAEVLIKYLKINNSQAGAIVVLDPRTGEILSIFSWPSYDNNLFIRGTSEDYLVDPNKPLFFRAIAGEYPSGSAIKPVIAAGALTEGIINETTLIFSQGGIKVGQWFFADWKPGGHGATDLVKALAESVNTFFYYIGGGYGDFKGLGAEGINQYARLFGLTKQTGIDLPGEGQGLLATPEWKEQEKNERWYIGDTYHLSIGQGDILVTPLQVANYTAAIANGGILFQPHLVREINDPETSQKRKAPQKVIRENFIDLEDLNLIKKGLRAAVTKGSARKLANLAIEIAGKTGTAQVGGGKKPHAWFTGFAPYQNPEIVLTVLIENGGEGSEAAVPAAVEILSFLFETREAEAIE